VVYWLSNDMKIIDLGCPWRSLATSMVGYLSNSWAFCLLGQYLDGWSSTDW